MTNDKKINLDEIDKLLELARIEIPQEEKENLSSGLNSILEYIQELEKIDTTDINIDKNENMLAPLRKDELFSKSENYRDILIDSFMEKENDKLKVSSILDKTK